MIFCPPKFPFPSFSTQGSYLYTLTKHNNLIYFYSAYSPLKLFQTDGINVTNLLTISNSGSLTIQEIFTGASTFLFTIQTTDQNYGKAMAP